jgi:hypothetical protein
MLSSNAGEDVVKGMGWGTVTRSKNYVFDSDTCRKILLLEPLKIAIVGIMWMNAQVIRKVCKHYASHYGAQFGVEATEPNFYEVVVSRSLAFYSISSLISRRRPFGHMLSLVS